MYIKCLFAYILVYIKHIINVYKAQMYIEQIMYISYIKNVYKAQNF